MSSMRIYFSGIGGVGIGPLAEIAHDVKYEVVGSDLAESAMTKQLLDRGIAVTIGQDGTAIARLHSERPIDWFVYTAALPDDHPELVFARSHNIRIAKRDELIAHIVRENGLKLIAIAGTHGKTTTTGLLVWVLQQLGQPVSYSVGTELSFGPSGAFSPDSKYFIYECDEYDRNFLHFEPSLSLITSLDYDHVDTYTTIEEYRAAFVKFLQQSSYSILWEKDLRYLRTDPEANLEAYDEHMDLSFIHLAGQHVRQNAYLVMKAIERIYANSKTAARQDNHPSPSRHDILQAINTFPGTSRRFEKLADNLYSDYGHHPAEIAATLQLAKELSDTVVLVYQPHQNVRQHEVRHDYTAKLFESTNQVYWLPTYLSREDSALDILSPAELTDGLPNVHLAQMNDELWQAISSARANGALVVCMGAGDIDRWVRSELRARSTKS